MSLTLDNFRLMLEKEEGRWDLEVSEYPFQNRLAYLAIHQSRHYHSLFISSTYAHYSPPLCFELQMVSCADPRCPQ